METSGTAGLSSFYKQVGFTLVELMIVISIVGILASIAAPKFADMVRRAQEAQSKGSLGTLRSAVSIYYSDLEGQYPANLYDLTINGDFLTALPILQLPPYHPKNPLAQVFASAAGGDIIVNSVTVGERMPGLGPTWCIGECLVVNCSSSNWGTVWISCSHTDSKGTVWSTY